MSPLPPVPVQNDTVLKWLSNNTCNETTEPLTPTYISPSQIAPEPTSKFSWTNSSIDGNSPDRRRRPVVAGGTTPSHASANNSISPRSRHVRSDQFQSWTFGDPLGAAAGKREEPVTPTPFGGASSLLRAQQEILISPKTKLDDAASIDPPAAERQSYFDFDADSASDDESSPQRIRYMVSGAFKRATNSSFNNNAGIGQSPKFTRRLWKRTVTDLSTGEREREHDQRARKRCASASSSTVSSIAETEYSGPLAALPSLTSSASTSVDSLASMLSRCGAKAPADYHDDVHTPVVPVADVDMDIDTIRTDVAPWLLHEEPWNHRDSLGELAAPTKYRLTHSNTAHRRQVSDLVPCPPSRPARRLRISAPPPSSQALHKRTLLPYDPKRRPKLTAIRSDTTATNPPELLTADSIMALERAIAAAKVACDSGETVGAAAAGQSRRPVNAPGKV